ncbi:Myb-like DNA-binding domain-containing protein [Spironucleus salmonicida]|uniref:Myb-like DNA-binding domain-containing protein n=1 Tax=Spironucleus salmonicida TaxID=348837 RepID=V6LDV6_9EUKA|nr:Myb-like DNA-binding domain-containing protein [Spironucleus salmonicida]|eukprot:EST42463.1 Myb-like DNA-binding domain-containing protein [Spironucleus salmonicida]
MNHHKWSDEEIEKLYSAIKIYGLDWKQIQQNYFQNLTPLTIKNKYYKKTKSKQNVSIKEELEVNFESSIQRQRQQSKPQSSSYQDIQQSISVPPGIPSFQIQPIPNIPYIQDQQKLREIPQFVQPPIISDIPCSNNLSIEFNGALASLPWTRNHSLPQTNEPSIVIDDDNIDNKDFVSQLINTLQQRSNMMFSPLMSPGEKSEN